MTSTWNADEWFKTFVCRPRSGVQSPGGAKAWCGFAVRELHLSKTKKLLL